ncbi:uncharacterized protein A4U43_C04F21050 [Asparagus officinalis]|uniref:Uncharacterized protein n=1 Tax=Asparagus officinalis TaxID=4686 RepID=A0A5P1F2K8_ASPOF|nr:uncharacterized protein LOC109837688 [Asparagus officinalis]XP_020261609.1 uncharacterized protein LOC109837688 [Asparagus officinalis]ONK72596.1 uncharacterized protein A4U43_C04F21050 [Asparagus officinalis]
MDGTLTVDGGGSFSPFFIFLIVLALQALDGFLAIIKKRGSSSSEQAQLRQEIKQLLKEASSLSTPATFAQAAKLRRTAAAKEKELLKKKEEQAKDSKLSHGLYGRTLLVLKVLLYIGLCWCFWTVPVAAVPQHLLQPFGSFLSWRSKDSATGLITVGIIPWLVLSSRVSKFMCQKFSKAIALK